MKIKSNYVGTYYFSCKNMVQQVFMTWSNLKWSKEYTPFGPTDNWLDQSPSDWSPRNTLTRRIRDVSPPNHFLPWSFRPQDVSSLVVSPLVVSPP